MSENIRVMSIVGRFLEHSRVYFFNCGGKPDVLIGSADAMRRNLDRRIEVLVPVEDPVLSAHIRDQILEICLKDNSQSWDLDESGKYTRRQPNKGTKSFDSQKWFMEHPSTKAQSLRQAPTQAPTQSSKSIKSPSKTTID